MAKEVKGEAMDELEPSASSTPLDVPTLRGGYSQTYVIRRPQGPGRSREVLFRCGKWCYAGSIELPVPEVTLRNVPVVIPSLQRQQGGLKYICEASAVPRTSVYRAPLDAYYDLVDFMAEEIGSGGTTELIERWADVFKWLDNSEATYFELQSKPIPDLSSIEMIASKTFTRGLILVMIYLGDSLYATIHDGEGSQPLLDVRFPDVSRNGHGLHIRSYSTGLYQKLTIWEALPADLVNSSAAATRTTGAAASASADARRTVSRPQRTFKSLAGTGYVQTYIVLERPSGNLEPAREALFRFGSWCYGGNVHLGEHRIGLQHTPIVIQALRLQQSSLKFVFDVSKVPETSRFLSPLEHMQDLCVRIQDEVLRCTDILERDVAGGNRRDLESWLEDDNAVSFFEFQTAGCDVYEGVELMATKVYQSGVVLIVLYFEGTFYVVIQDAESEQPLLDSRFPDVSSKGRGYQFGVFDDGIEGWPELRRIALWQTVPRAAITVDSEEEEERQEEEVVVTSSAQAKQVKSEGPRTVQVGAATAKAAKGEYKPPQEEEDDNNASSRAAARKQHQSDARVAATPVTSATADAKAPAKMEQSNSVRKAVATPKVALPHHLAPLRGIVPHTALQGGDMGRAPWDATGRPLGSPTNALTGGGAKGLGGAKALSDPFGSGSSDPFGGGAKGFKS